jgi:hypothetical protein
MAEQLTIKTYEQEPVDDIWEYVYTNVVESGEWVCTYEQIIKNKETGEVFGFLFNRHHHGGDDCDEDYILDWVGEDDEDLIEIRRLYPVKEVTKYTTVRD